MIVKKIVKFSRASGEKISETVAEELPISEDDYWKSVAAVIFNTTSYQEFLKNL